MGEHPPSYRVDAHAAGDVDAVVVEHLRTCDACRTYFETVKRGATEFASAEGARAGEVIAGLRTGAKIPKVSRVARLAWLGAPLLAAAAILLAVRVSLPVPPPAAEATPETRFKGNVQVAVVRDRAGAQQRSTTEVSVRPGDRILVEVGVDRRRPMVVGLLGKDGEWDVLLAPVELEVGTHYSDHAARFDDRPTDGWIVAGHPKEVERAKMTKLFDQVSVIPVVVER